MASTPGFQRVVRIALSGLLALPQAVAPAATITVRGACTLPDAITAANRNAAVGACPAGSGADTIRLTADVDLIAADKADNGLPQISSKIEIRGRGFAIERNASAPPFRILDVLPSGNLTLDRVTVANGKTPTNGGGIRTLGTLTLKNSTVSGNESGNRGGGIYANAGYTEKTVTLVNSSVSQNTARRGAGITGYDGARLAISGSTISDNVAVSRGGGILLHRAAYRSTISNSTIASNSASSGAGIRATFYSGLEITDTTISDNTSTRFEGGGIFSVYSDLTLERSRVTGNTASRGGGIFTDDGYGTIRIRSSTLSGNTASEAGGGAFFSGYQGDVQLTNTTVSGNSAPTGGGIFLPITYYRFESDILFSTITQNTASLGAGIYAMNAEYADYHTLAGSLVAGNNGGNCAGPGLTFGGNNFDDDGSCSGAGAIVPGIDFDTALANNGGPTRTHALLEGSVAIDSGGDCVPFLATDQRGFPRDARCDSGSFEFGAEGLGASVTGVANRKVFCKNVASRQKGKTRTERSSWLCDDLGVTASSSERVLLWSIGIADGTAPVGGSVSGLDKSRKPRVVCRNKTRGRKVAFASDTPSWNCEAEGLVVEPGDSIQQKIKGRV